jgi:hypothetical protein
MILERGPNGTIAVITIESEKDVILHALEVLQNRSCPHFLPVYLREQMEKTQICVDCTGLIRLTDSLTQTLYPTLEKKKNAIIELILSIPDSLDFFLEPSGISFHSSDIWIDPTSGNLYFTYLPIRFKNRPQGCFLSSVPADELEEILLNPFFSDVIKEEDRHQIICTFQSGNETRLRELLNEIVSSDPKAEESVPAITKCTIAWSLQLILMLLSLAIIKILSNSLAFLKDIRIWGIQYIAIFALCAAVIPVIHAKYPRVKRESAVLTRTANARKDMLFPESHIEAGKTSEYSDVPVFSPAFLTEQAEYGSIRKGKRLRSVIWTDDFLIGSDNLLCDFSIDHPSVSDRHARILRREGTFFLVDLGSSHGSYISHRKLYTHEENPISHNEIIRIGDVRFLFTCQEAN